jgi:hypothetical protein
MSKRANYLTLAHECEELAEQSTSEESAEWMMAQATHWRSLADDQPRDRDELN